MVHVDGVTIERLIEAVQRGDRTAVAGMLACRPELVHVDRSESDEHRALHHAVLQRQPAMVRLLVQHGADAHKGIWPHRDATSPLTLAIERGYDDIVSAIREEESRRSSFAIAPDQPAVSGPTDPDPQLRQAVAAGDVTAVRAGHESGRVTDGLGLVGVAVASGQPAVLRLLLELGLDPDERERVDGLDDVVYAWGGPLRACAIRGDLAMAEILLQHGATPNTNVYAASSAMSEAYERRHSTLVERLERHGGLVNATTAGYLGLADRVRHLFDEEAAGRLPEGVVPSGRSVADAVLEAAADNGHVELVRMAVAQLDWPAGDTRWHWMLMRPLGHHPAHERGRFLDCCRSIVERSGVHVIGPLGRTLLHDVSAAWPRSSPMRADDRVAFATLLIEQGARLDVRDDLLKSTPLGWACRWGRLELVELLLARGADAVEAGAEPWATPRAWAAKMGQRAVLRALDDHGAIGHATAEG